MVSFLQVRGRGCSGVCHSDFITFVWPVLTEQLPYAGLYQELCGYKDEPGDKWYLPMRSLMSDEDTGTKVRTQICMAGFSNETVCAGELRAILAQRLFWAESGVHGAKGEVG